MTTLLDLRVVRELALIEVSPGDSLLPHFLETFAGDAGASLERMRAQARVADPRVLASEAHRLKGGSTSIGAVQLAGELAEIERSARAGTTAGLEGRIARALELLYASCDAILCLCHRPAPRR
jgi:HPt (histidine-containing phosphotransfer) domain-containing protein